MFPRLKGLGNSPRLQNVVGHEGNHEPSGASDKKWVHFVWTWCRVVFRGSDCCLNFVVTDVFIVGFFMPGFLIVVGVTDDLFQLCFGFLTELVIEGAGICVASVYVDAFHSSCDCFVVEVEVVGGSIYF